MRFRSLNAKEYYYARFHAVQAAGRLRSLQGKLKATPSLKNVHRFKCELKIAQIQAESTACDEAYWERKFTEELRYSPDQPRVPAGHPTGGQWTSENGGNASSNNSSDQLLTDAPDQPARGDLQALHDLVNNQLIRSRIKEAWQASAPNSQTPQEYGFWISKIKIRVNSIFRPLQTKVLPIA